MIIVCVRLVIVTNGWGCEGCKMYNIDYEAIISCNLSILLLKLFVGLVYINILMYKSRYD